MLLFASAGTFILGYVGQASVVFYVTRKYHLRGSPKEPACPYCGYGLYYARDHVCPECGQPFLGTNIDMRLATWEDGVLKPKSPQETCDAGQEERESK
jgi:hypothetical protein